jgi:signal transduction histidine kinase
VRRYFAQHPRASDVVVCLAFVLGSISEVGEGVSSLVQVSAEQRGAGAAVGSMVLTALGVVTLWFRWPIRVAGTTALLAVAHVLVAGGIGGFGMGFALALYVVAATRPQRTGWVVLAGATVLVTGSLLVWGVDGATGRTAAPVVITAPDGTVLEDSAGPSTASDVSTFLVLGLIAMAVGANVRGRRLHTRIAREMHDVVAHGLTVMIALSDGARVAVRRSPDDAERALDLLSETGRSALADMRRMLGVLRGADVPLEPQPGTQDLESLVQQFRAAGLTVHLTTAGPPLPSDAGLALTVYRVVQESLTNALRHAGPGSRVDVLVRHGESRVGIEVVDDGNGAAPVAEPPSAGPGLRGRLSERLGTTPEARTDADPVTTAAPAPVPTVPGVTPPPVRTGRGLVGMRERAAVYRGTVTAGPYRAGWRVHVELRTDDTAPTDPEEHP